MTDVARAAEGELRTDGPRPGAHAPPARRSWPGGRAALVALVLLALALRAPLLGMGFYLDDCIVRLAHEHPELVPTLSAWSVYDFGDAADWRAPSAADVPYPWWMDEDWRIRFFRPLTSLSLLLDDFLFDGAAVLWHVTSLAWFSAALLLAHALYRGLGLSSREALLALALLAASSTSVVPAGWIANRNAVIALVFAELAVLVLVRARRPAGAPALAAASGCALLACLAKESGVIAFGLIAAFLLLDPRATEAPAEQRARRRGAALALSLALAWVVGLAVLGFGTHSGFYATPWSEPGRFLGQLAVHVLGGATSLATPIMLDTLTLQPGFVPFAAGAGVVVLALTTLGLRRFGRGRKELGFFLAWTALFFLPQGIAPPAGRLLFESSLGSAALFAVLICAGVAARARVARAGAWALFVLAGPLSALGTLWFSAAMAQMAEEMRTAARAADVGPTDVGRRNVFILQAENGLVPFALAATWAVHSEDHDVRFWNLHTGRREVRWTGVDERTFELRFDEPILTLPFERVYLGGGELMDVGQRWQTPLFEVEALEVAEGRPTALRLRFAEPAFGERTRFLAWRDGGCRRLVPPAPGETLVLPRIVPPNAFVP